jgi:hypothetical protein
MREATRQLVIQQVLLFAISIVIAIVAMWVSIRTLV